MMWPATPSQKPNWAKIRKAIASLCFRYARSACLSVKIGGEVDSSATNAKAGSPLPKALEGLAIVGDGGVTAEGAILFVGLDDVAVVFYSGCPAIGVRLNVGTAW